MARPSSLFQVIVKNFKLYCSELESLSAKKKIPRTAEFLKYKELRAEYMISSKETKQSSYAYLELTYIFSIEVLFTFRKSVVQVLKALLISL